MVTTFFLCCILKFFKVPDLLGYIKHKFDLFGGGQCHSYRSALTSYSYSFSYRSNGPSQLFATIHTSAITAFTLLHSNLTYLVPNHRQAYPQLITARCQLENCFVLDINGERPTFHFDFAFNGTKAALRSQAIPVISSFSS